MFWDTVEKKFVAELGPLIYCDSWLTKDYYMDMSNNPRTGALFYHKDEHSAYTWNGSELIPIGEGQRISDEEIDALAKE